MGESERELELVRGDVGVAPALERAREGRGPYAEGGARNTEGAHDGFGGGEDAIAVLPVPLRGVFGDRPPAEVLQLGVFPRIRPGTGLARYSFYTDGKDFISTKFLHKFNERVFQLFAHSNLLHICYPVGVMATELKNVDLH